VVSHSSSVNRQMSFDAPRVGVVDENVDAAVLVDRVLDNRLGAGPRRRGAIVGDRAAAFGADLLDDARRIGHLVGNHWADPEIIDDDLCSGPRQLQRMFRGRCRRRHP